MSRAAVQALYGQDQADTLARRLEQDCDPEIRRWASDTGLYRLGLAIRPRRSLRNAGILALEDLAVTSRDKVAAINGVGPRTLAQLEPGSPSTAWAGRRHPDAGAATSRP